MILSLNWLRQFVKLPERIDPKDLAERLVMHTAEIDKYWRQDEFLENVVVGRVLEINAHPNADKLKLCTVSDGKENYQVVCGGTNVREGMKCAFARVGAKVKWHGEEVVTLAQAEIRGKKSFGMICAAEELGLALGGEGERDIMDLGGIEAEIGTPLAQALGADDAFFEVDNKAINHRPDLWGQIGFAREVAALYDKPFAMPEPSSLTAGKPWSLKVRIESSKFCPRYQAVVIENVRVAPSPLSVQRRLRACGVRPINNVVDATNWVMLELGQPMHAFDVAALKTKPDAAHIIVRPAKRGEKMLALDSITYTLTPEMLVIADEDHAVAIAGVIGGEKSAVTESTQTILFESANFNPASVRATAKKLGIRTESSARFEKALDPTLTSIALARAVELLREWSPDISIASPIADVGVWKTPEAEIELSVLKIQSVLGVAIPTPKIKTILEQLGFGVRVSGKTLRAAVPTWRATRDVLRPEDVIEEIGRSFGYENIPPAISNMSVTPPRRDPVRMAAWQVRDTLVRELGYAEVLRYSFVGNAILEILGESSKEYIALQNPLDLEYMRQSLVPNLLTRLEEELHTRDTVDIFEIGKVFINNNAGSLSFGKGSKRLPEQPTWFTALTAGRGEKKPFRAARRVIEQMEKETSNVWTLKKEKLPFGWAHPGRSAVIEVDGAKVGWITELHPGRARALGIEAPVGMVGISLSELGAILIPRKKYVPLPLHPEVVRDIAFLITRNVTHDTLAAAIHRASTLAGEVKLFDIFEGKNIPEGEKSMAFHITYAFPGKTLTGGEVDSEHEAVARALKKLGAKIR